jgi:ATP-dependent DNA helicase RecG
MYKEETQYIEYKSSWKDEYLKVVCAFANTDGGELIVGVDNDGNPVGVDNSRYLLENIPNKIHNLLGIIPHVILTKENHLDIIHISINPSRMPISFRGKYYIRSGSTTQILKGNELSQFMLKKMDKSWDNSNSGLPINYINKEIIYYFVDLAKTRIPNISNSDTVEKILSNLNLIHDRTLKNAAILLFGRKPQDFFISAKTRIGRLKNSIDFIDTKIAEGTIFEQLETIIETIKKHLDVKFMIEDIQRKDIWDYPIEAIREAVINALIHKNYLEPAEIQIKIFADKIWFWNPGELPPQLKIDDLKRDHSSYPRNPLMANVFYHAGLIEKWGSGTKRIIELCRVHGLPDPEYKEEFGGFSVWIYKDVLKREKLKQLGLNEREIKAVLYIKENGSITNQEYQNISNVKKRQASNDLNKLIEKGFIERIGVTGRGTYYCLKYKGQKRSKRGIQGVLKEHE